MKDKPDNDMALFFDAVGDVKPVEHNTVVHERVAPSTRPLQSLRDEQAVLRDMMSDEYVHEDLQPGQILDYCAPGVQKTTYRKLRTGQYRMDAELDLHGLTTRQAREELTAFLHTSRSREFRCVRIIHGKGLTSPEGPILKSRINTWLRLRGDVLAFHSARPADGGTGAVYVLLKSSRKA